MMGPLSGVGDTIYQGVLIPILLAICIDMNRKGTIWGSIIYFCLLYTSDAADDTPCVDLGGRRIIKKKKQLYR
ncbi:PTS system mannose/fructose/sorbose-specific IID component [Lactobacillus rhamnosus GG] [Lacticaseibacillus rhamnosus]|nr:PTS system mannose/fructose/sorbose-specific IID component [Lactobacillus rhamnosus GG] [Lacticaseibacillus rhamnosus]